MIGPRNSRECSGDRSRLRISLGLVLLAGFLAFPIGLASASPGNLIKTYVIEQSDNPYYGAKATWTYPPDPDTVDQEPGNYVQTFVYGQTAVGYVEVGETHDAVVGGSDFKAIYSRYQDSQETDYRTYGTDSQGSHTLYIEQRTVGCAGGASTCWHFREDGSDLPNSPTCCSARTLSEIRIGQRCLEYDGDANCQSGTTQKIDPMDSLKYMTAGGSWPDWAGQDGYCVEYSHNARGKWTNNSDHKVTVGFNVTVNNSLSGC